MSFEDVKVWLVIDSVLWEWYAEIPIHAITKIDISKIILIINVLLFILAVIFVNHHSPNYI